MKEYLRLLSSRAGFMAVIGANLLVPDSSVLNLMGYILVDTSFDVFGFTHTDQSRGSASYRIIQKMFQFAVLLLIYIHVGPTAVIACLIASWLLVCDVLFYFALSLPLEPFSWFKESPVNFFFITILKRPVTPVWAVLVSSGLGFALAIAIAFSSR